MQLKCGKCEEYVTFYSTAIDIDVSTYRNGIFTQSWYVVATDEVAMAYTKKDR
jgi:hypothetical protein